MSLAIAANRGEELCVVESIILKIAGATFELSVKPIDEGSTRCKSKIRRPVLRNRANRLETEKLDEERLEHSQHPAKTRFPSMLDCCG
jgi:hypothetical protein